MNRSQRRAAERLNQKTATAPQQPNSNISDAQLAANRLNAQSSAGPKTETGRAHSALNSLKTGLTGRTVLLPIEDVAIYQHHLNRFFTRFSPATDQEKTLVQSIADTEWRLLRIAPLEAGIYAIGQIELAHLHPDEKDPVTRHALIHAQVFLAYRRELNNLALQERRLRNQRQADTTQLETLQKERLDKEKKTAQKPVAHQQPQRHQQPTPTENGFVFSDDEIDRLTRLFNASKPTTTASAEPEKQEAQAA